MTISLLPEWFEECLAIHQHPKNYHKINGIVISGVDSYLPYLECITKDFRTDGRIVILPELEKNLQKKAPFKPEERSGRGVISAASAVGYSVEWDITQPCLWIHELSTGRSLGVNSFNFSHQYHHPLREFIHWRALTKPNSCLVHAAIISKHDVGILIIGEGNAGKSTTVAAAILAGWKTLGDDYVWLEQTAEGVLAKSVYRSLKLRSSSPALSACYKSDYFVNSDSNFYCDDDNGFIIDDGSLDVETYIKHVVFIDSTLNSDLPLRDDVSNLLMPLILSTVKQAPGGHALLLDRIRKLTLNQLSGWKIGYQKFDGSLIKSLEEVIEYE